MNNYKYFTGNWYSDCAIMTEFLDELEFYSGTSRKQMYKMPKGVNGGSMTYGVDWKGYLAPGRMREKDEETGLYKTKIYSECPYMKDVLTEFGKIWFPEFESSQFQLNKNFITPRHLDSKNRGESYIVGFGNYAKGELVVEDEKGKETLINISIAPFKFDGAKYYHWTKPFTGTRYSVVWFASKFVKSK